MKYGLISDIHANWEALEAVLEALGEVDAYLCLGDVVGYGANPNECCERVRELGCTTIIGNHDEAALGRMDLNWFNPYARAAVEWTMAALTPENRKFLESLPATAEVDDFLLVHGALPDPWMYITSPLEALLTFQNMEPDLCFIGHTHVAEYYYVEKNQGSFPSQVSLRRGGTVQVTPERRFIVNCGGVGQPRDGNPQAAAGIYDTETREVEVLRVDYDLPTAQRKIRAAGLPSILADRLAFGR
ncbi:MAG TPA: metallophosphoesterase [Armatimonadetes bacterium]|nr:metallophosphoesterase [Armatimonadota bacterium]